MLRRGLHLLGGSERAKRLATGTSVTRAVSRRFVPGERIDSVVAAAEAVNQQGLTATMNYLGEAVRTGALARAAAGTYLELLDRIRTDGLDANISVKPTQLGQEIDEQLLLENLETILERSRPGSIFVRIDMESSRYTKGTLAAFETLWSRGHRNVGVVLQSALRRTEGDVGRMIELGARVRLCKGAYAEPTSVAFDSTREIRRSFFRSMKRLLREGSYPAIATHDEGLIQSARKLVQREGIRRDAFEFQLLYGVRRDLQEALVADGYRVRVYIPFGEMWYPYLMRRLAERPENFFFLVGNVLRESPLGVLWPGGNSSPPSNHGGRG